MTNFIYDNTSPGVAKTDNKLTSIPATKKITSTDWNTFRQALLDIQSHARGATAVGLAAQEEAPAISGVGSFMWLDDDGELHVTHAAADRVVGKPADSLSVKDYGAKGDWNATTLTGTDDRTAIGNTIIAAITAGKNVQFPPGQYRLSKYVHVTGAYKLKIFGSAFSSIHYNSDDLAVTSDGTALSNNEARSAFLFTNCSSPTLENITFVGGDHPLSQRNIGSAVYARRTVGLTITKCDARYGHSLLQQEAAANSTGTGDSIAVAAGIATLTDAGALFRIGHRGRFITVANTSDPRNSGTFEILSATSTTVTYANADAQAETSSFAWAIDDADRDTNVEMCRSERVRGILTPGPKTRIVRCTFEQPATYDLTGIGDSFTDDGATTTLSDANATWDASVVGRYIKIVGATTTANNGTFLITAATAAGRYTPGTITYANASGATEATVVATTSWLIVGGDKVGLGAGADGLELVSFATMRLTSAVPSFSAADVGKVLHVTGVTTLANYGAFVIKTFISSTEVEYENGLGSTEAYAGVWSVDSHDSWPGDGGTYGSNHAIYIFGGGRWDILVDGCIFLNIRKTCVKVSASADAIEGVQVRGCFARECGTFVVAGADDTQRHTGININHNHIVDCGIGRRGWQDQVAIDILGSRGTKIINNTIRYTHNCLEYVRDVGSVSDRFAISAKRYSLGFSQPLEDLLIQGNDISADPRTTHFGHVLDCAVYVRAAGSIAFYGTGGTFTKSGSIMTLTAAGSLGVSRDNVGDQITTHFCAAGGNDTISTILSVGTSGGNIIVTFTNAGGTGGGSACGAFRITPRRPHPTHALRTANHLRILGNTVNGAGSIAFKLDTCASPEFRGNAWCGVATGLTMLGCSMPIIANNHEVSQTNNNASIILGAGTSWPIVYDNFSGNAAVSSTESIKAALRIADASGSTIVDYPLLGKSGRARPSDAKEEIVMAYGGGWADGDKVYVWNGSGFTTCTYKASGPVSPQFNSFSGLLTIINNIANISAADYGTGFSDGDVATQHIRIRNDATSATQGTLFVILDVANPTAGVLLRNQVASGSARCDSRGGGSAGPTADKTVVWSQLCRLAGGPILYPDNAAAMTLLAGSFRTVKDTNNDGCCAVVLHGTSAGTEEIRWTL